ncbi:MAG TPA: hypothetical protein PLX04_08810 [Caldisericia bacterium]|nr:hypothetical protein [Caldisericia bacterium]HOU08790.1 hypothetical protein [Caldisericia bacterium]HPL90338.1 hypothetical protein [Caldisericia bacterium]HQG60163.1 hypothetical protein [Caldisericia bacterium]HQJ44889.1 hypothetical protein [Caldisericia bacterium]
MKTPISIPFPASEKPKLKFSIGACKFNLRPGDGTSWVEGTYDDPTDNLPCIIEQSGNEVSVSQSRNISGLINVFNRTPTFDLVLSSQNPFDLVIEGGASENCIELGGLPLSSVAVSFGAGKFEMSFLKPNPILMDSFRVSTGAGSMTLSKLLNAGFKNLKVEGGAASYKIDFTGKLGQDCNANIQIGVASLDLDVPSDVPVAVKSETTLGGVEMGSGFTTKDGRLVNQAYLANPSPALSISTSIALGSLKLRIANSTGGLRAVP